MISQVSQVNTFYNFFLEIAANMFRSKYISSNSCGNYLPGLPDLSKKQRKLPLYIFFQILKKNNKGGVSGKRGK